MTIHGPILRYKMALLLSLVFTGIFLRPGFAENEDFPVSRAVRVLEPPVLDGRLDDPAWEVAEPLTGLVAGSERYPAKFPAEFRFVYDDEALYCAIRAYEPDLDGLQVNRDPNNVWWDDCFEIFLDPQATRVRYFQYLINAAGTLDSGYVGDFAADIPADTAAGKAEDAWTVEVRIPFASLGTPPFVGERWGLNVTRVRNAKAEGEEREVSIWSPTGNQHGSPGQFGYLIFAPLPGEAAPLEHPDRKVTDTLLARIADEFHGNWRFTHEDVGFEERNLRARKLLGLHPMIARFPDKRLVHYVRPAIRDEHVLPWTVPPPEEVGRGIELTACRGEFESGTFGIFALEDLEEVTIEFSDLEDRNGNILPKDIADPFHVLCWYQAGVGTIHRSRRTLLAELLVKNPLLILVDAPSRENLLNFEGTPQDARTLKPIDIPAWESRQVWINYRIPEDAPAGFYTGSIRVRDAKGTLANVPVSIRVPAWDLAPSPMLHGLYYNRRMPRLESIEDEEAFFKVVEEEIRLQIEYGCNVVATYIHTTSLPSDSSPTATAQRVSDIQKKYGVTGTPYFGVVDHVGYQQGEQLPAVTERARLLNAWACANNRNGFCFQGRDEASGRRLTEQRPSWEAARAGGGKMWVACRPSYFEYMGDILDYPVVTGRLRPELAKKVHEMGFRILSYGNPQAGVELPALYRRNYGLALRAAGYDGSINYELGTLDPAEAYDDFIQESYRHHNFAYPALDRPIATIQFAGWREAVDDVRYARTLEKAISAALDRGNDEDFALESRGWLDSITGFEDLDKVRAEMIRRIDRLMKE